MRKSIHTVEYEVLCQALKAARGRSGLTQRALATQLRVSPSWVAKVEMGERRLDVVELVRFTDACGERADLVLKQVEGALAVHRKRRAG